MYHNDTNIIIYNIEVEFKYIINNYKKFNFVNNNDSYTSLISKNLDIKINYLIWLDDLDSTSKTNEIFAKNINFLIFY